MSKSDPLAVLLSVREEINANIDEDLVKSCYRIQCEHQYDKDRNTMKKMQALVESAININEGNSIL